MIKKAERLNEIDVHAAMEAMIEIGEKPTALNLLKALGRGSLTTITKFMNSFNKPDAGIVEDKFPCLGDVPKEINLAGELLIKRIWTDARAFANHEIESQRNALIQAETEATNKINEAMEFSEVQAKQIEEMEGLLDELRQIIAEKDESITALSTDVRNLTQALNKESRDKELALQSYESAKTALEKSDRYADELKAGIADGQKKYEESAESLRSLEKTNKSLDLQIGKQQIALDQQANNLEALRKELTHCKTECKEAGESAARLSGKLEVYEKLNIEAKQEKPKKPIKKSPMELNA